MRTKKLISMLMLPAAFVACTDDYIESNGFAGVDSAGEIVEDYVLGVTFGSDEVSRAAYAGSADKGVYQNFYLEPEYDEKRLRLSNNNELYGDMLGYCLTDGANAITNLPFYIAGYGAALSEAEDAKPTVYTFGETGLYDLGLDEVTYNVKDVLHGEDAKDSIDASIAAIAKKNANEALGADSLDVRKGIVRTNAGVMTGNYVAYFPYNKNWVEPSGIPAVGMKNLYEVENLSDTREAALEAVNFYKYLFAVSQTTNEVKGGTKSGDVSLKPLTSALTFKLVYTAEIEDEEDNTTDTIKRITIRSIEEGAAAFTLNGNVPLNSLGTITASESTDLIGVSFEKTQLDTADVKYVTIPYYPNPAVTGYVIEVYNDKGQVAAIEKETANFQLGSALLTTIDFKDLKFENTVRKIFSEADFIEEAVAGGDLMLMVDVTVDGDVLCAFEKDLNILGAKKLTLTTGEYKGKITMAEGSELVLNGATISGEIDADKVTVNGTYGNWSNKLTAKTVVVERKGTLYTKGDAVLGAVDNYGCFNAIETEREDGSYTSVVIDVLNNYSIVEASGLTVGTVNNKAISGKRIDGGENALLKINSMTAGTIYNEAAVEDDPATKNVNETKACGHIAVCGATSSAKVYNYGLVVFGVLNGEKADFNWDMDNHCLVQLVNCPNFKGTLNNNAYVYVYGSVEGVSGEVNNLADGYIEIADSTYAEGYFGFTNTKLNINAGKVVVKGDINGNNQITVAEGAEFIGNAANVELLESALGSDFINAKYTGIKVSSNEWPESVTSTNKKIYLNNAIKFKESTALNGGLVIEATGVEVAAEGKKLTVSDITIEDGCSLRVMSSTSVTVAGYITNDGVYSQADNAVVWCGGIAGAGTWTNKPKY